MRVSAPECLTGKRENQRPTSPAGTFLVQTPILQIGKLRLRSGKRGAGNGPESLGKSGPRPWSPDNESSADSGMREGGGNRVVGEEGAATYLTPALPRGPAPAPPPSSSPSPGWRGRGGRTGLRRRRRGGARGSLSGCRGAVGGVQAPASSFPADVDSPAHLRRVILAAAVSLSALWPDPASNAGRALQKEAWAGSQLGKAEPRNGGGEQPKPNEVQSFPYLPLPSFPTWETRERTKTFYLSCVRWGLGESFKPLLTALGVQGLTPPPPEPLAWEGLPLPFSWGRRGKRVDSPARRKRQPGQTFPMMTHRPGTP